MKNMKRTTSKSYVHFFAIWLRLIRNRHELARYIETYGMELKYDQIARAALLALAED